ncbi:MAG TPA: hypothetical protein VF573_05615 [Paraburkholderia sp.]|uniref:hypothetical protein n=1 Tax=Paraburkholderia sp. TaxID=1926495 RepID=UPI002ED1042D
MPTLYTAVISPWFEQRFLKIDGNGSLVPNAGGFVYTFSAGTTTPVDTWTNSDGDGPGGAAQENPIELDADGRPPSPIFLLGTGYKFAVHDSDDVLLYTIDNVEDSGLTFASQWGVLLGTGVSYTDGETIAVTTRLALIDSSGGATTIYLPASADASQPLTVKNMGTNAVTLTADGTDTLEGSLSTITIPAASSPTFPSVLIAPNQISDWTILSSHGVV